MIKTNLKQLSAQSPKKAKLTGGGGGGTRQRAGAILPSTCGRKPPTGPVNSIPMDTLLLVDGNAIMHRAYHALPPFKTKSGLPTNAAYGFFTMLYRTIQDFNPQYVTICFDTPKPTFRKKLFKKYQVHRPKMENDLGVQFPLVKDLLEKAGVYHEEKPGFEADDVIGSIAHHAKKNHLKVLILTGDKDIMQLIDDHVYTITPQIGFNKSKIYDRKEVIEKFGVQPEQIPDFKALAGDSSDNYPGAKGIGPKTASNLIKEYHSVENLLRNIDKLPEKIKKTVTKYKKNILLSKKLAQIITDMKIRFNLESAKFAGFKPELKDSLLKLEMYSLASRFFSDKKIAEQKAKKAKKKHEADSSQIGLF